MRLIALPALAAAFAVTLAVGTAGAAPKKGHYQAHRSHATTHITIRKQRSYLDPGTATLPYQQHFTDYVVQPATGPFDAVDPTHSRRFPLPDAFDLPGFNPYLY
jgi:hypothetical protein